jgi:hypothetical protein
MIDAIKHAKDVGVKDGDPYYGSITGLVGTIADPKAPLQAKDKLIEWAYNPKNVARLDELRMDYKDPQTNQWIPGKYRAFNILASDAVTQGVKETAAIHPENYVKYQGTLESEFAKLYRSSLLTLNKVIDGRIVPEDAQGRPVDPTTISLETPIKNRKVVDMHFSYNGENNNFGLVDNLNRPITKQTLSFKDPNYASKLGTLDILENVNGGISRMANVYRNNPQGAQDTGQRLLQMLQTSGFRPGQSIYGATREMMGAVIKSQNPDMTPEELEKKVLGSPGGVTPTSRFAPEEDRSLAAFLRSPAGNYSGGPRPRQGIQGNLSDEQLLSIDTQDIPEGMSAREFLQNLKKARR